ncbi:hypothetical protein ACIRPQ_14175 [Streptomyces sp. NPDC101213]|uniref:hypothetical protein n=1 Tax=Streptomyces sp. NPDC101213 TaxID=3366130 RepID=UPI003800C959
MFKHRRVRVTCVLVVGWIFFTVVEQRSGQTTWPASLLHALVWALAVSGTWWFAEMTQLGPRSARPVPPASATDSSRRPGAPATALPGEGGGRRQRRPAGTGTGTGGSGDRRRDAREGGRRSA